ncbi:hypothetical protein COCNU_scaffold007099G000010 [Cocos nucifera]|nr:hypothetical protein [Cocos nucifera]
MAPSDAAATFEAAEVPLPFKVPPVVGIDVTEGSMPPASMSSPIEDRPIKREGREEKKKKKKLTIMKVQRKARLGRSNDNNDLEEGPFSTPDTIRELVDKFALLKIVDQMIDLDDAQLIWDSLGTFLQVTALLHLFFFSPLMPL